MLTHSGHSVQVPNRGAWQNSLFPVHHSGDEWEVVIVSRRVQLQRSLPEARDTDNSATARWSACQECLHHSRMVFVCQNTLVIHCSITLNIGLLPCLGHSSSRCFFISPRIYLKQRECSHCTVQSIFPKITVTINFPFRGRVHLLQAFCHAVTSVHYGLFTHCYIRSAWGTFSHPLGFPFAQRLREFAAMVSLNTYEHLFLLGLLQYHCYCSSCIL